jgi:hypothetical protein
VFEAKKDYGLREFTSESLNQFAFWLGGGIKSFLCFKGFQHRDRLGTSLTSLTCYDMGTHVLEPLWAGLWNTMLKDRKNGETPVS